QWCTCPQAGRHHYTDGDVYREYGRGVLGPESPNSDKCSIQTETGQLSSQQCKEASGGSNTEFLRRQKTRQNERTRKHQKFAPTLTNKGPQCPLFGPLAQSLR